MAQVVQRTWRSGSRKAKKSAWGYTLMVNGKQERKYCATWTEDDARAALVARQEEIRTPPAAPVPPTPTLPLAGAIEKYLVVKSKKRSVRADKQHLGRLKVAFGADTPLEQITAARISEYKIERMKMMVLRDGEQHALAPATLNRELAVLRHLLKIAADEWEVLPKAPRIRMEKEPEGRIRWLEYDEEARLLKACRAAHNPRLAAVVTVALESGMRCGEIMGLTWERVDLSRGVIRLERTKGGRRREVPMRQVVYDLLAAMPEPRIGRVWPDRSIRRAFEKAVAEAKLEDFVFHDCRHHFASWFVMRGGSLQALKEILGHRDIKMTLRYAHLAPGHLRSEIEKTANATLPAHGSAQGRKIEAEMPVSS